jgi:hypothetical protein
MPIFDFNANMYQFRKDGYCNNPNSAIKGYVYSNKIKSQGDGESDQ